MLTERYLELDDENTRLHEKLMCIEEELDKMLNRLKDGRWAK